MSEYIECGNCGFVLLSESREEARPTGRDSCPDCGGTEFRFTGE